MKRFIAPLAVMLLAGIAPLAQATITITYTVDALAPVPCFNAGQSVTCADATVGNIKISNLGGSSNWTGDPSQSWTSSSTASLQNTDSATSHTIHIDVVVQGFTVPTAPPTLEFDSSVAMPAFGFSGTGNVLHFQSCVDQSNGTLAGGTSDCLGSVPGVSPYVATQLTLSGPGSVKAPTEHILLLGPASYAIDEAFDITVGVGGKINFSAGDTLTPVPEPMSIALLGGVVLLTSRLIRRKQNQAS